MNTTEQLAAALREASRALCILDPLAEEHDAVIIDEALARYGAERAQAPTPNDHLRAFFAGIRQLGAVLPLKDATAVQMIADALDVLSPDDAEEGEEDVAAAVGYYAMTFATVAESMRDEEEAE